MDRNVFVEHEEEFTVNHVPVVVSLYRDKDRHKITLWLYGKNEIDTIDVTDFINKGPSENGIINRMHQAVHDAADNIIDRI